jgi:stage II sporulation protein D
MMNFKGSSKTLLFVFLFSFSTLAFKGVHASENRELQSFADAQELIVRGSYLEAISVFREISLSSEDPQTRSRSLFQIASVYENFLDLPENAISYYRDLSLMYPESPFAPDALFNTGRIYYNSGRYKEALKAFEDYIDRYPKGSRMPSVKSWADSAERKCRSTGSPGIHHNGIVSLAPTIRVVLQKKADRFSIDGPADLTVKSFDKGETVYSGKGPITVTRSKKKMLLNGKALDGEAYRISGQGDYLAIGGKKYRGDLVLHVKSTGLMAVNHLNVESYLYGVVPKEMSPLWSLEALTAQAIASRTYALYIREKRAAADRDYDVEATTSSQVYGGYDAEKESARAAVDASKGIVLSHDDKLIISYFHANSGGCTESSLNVWGVDLPYLQSIEDGYSKEDTEPSWEYTVSYKELGRIFSKLLSGSELKKVELLDKSPSGRVMNFLLCSDSKKVKVSGNSFRLSVGPVNVKSTILDIIPDKNGLTFKGTGYGHGVGMSQFGAQRMAIDGRTSEEILKHYYKGVDILKVSYF